jgi:hypothetical protein
MTARLPADVWFRSFEYSEPIVSPSDLRNIMLVCRTWKVRISSYLYVHRPTLFSRTLKDIAEPLLFREGFFLKPAQFSAFATCVVMRSFSKKRNAGRWVKTLVIAFMSNVRTHDSVFEVKLNTLLFHLPNLESFSCPYMPIAQDELIPLASNSNPCLQQIHLIVGGRGASRILVLSVLDHIHTLRELVITLGLSEESVSGRHSLSEFSGLELPRLKRLSLDCQDKRSDHALSAVLGRSRFPALTFLSLSMFAAEADMPGLCAFFEAHSGITELELGNIPHHLDMQLLEKAQHVVHFKSRSGLPNVAIIEHLPATCQTLAFGYEKDKTPTRIGEIATRLQARPLAIPSLREIRITDKFLWSTGQRLNISDAEAQAQGRMMHFAAFFRERGICIRDANGATIVFA